MSKNKKELNEEVREETLVGKLLNIGLYCLFGLTVIILILKLFFFGYYSVNGDSMLPTFEDNERFIAPLVHKSTELEKDDVVIVKTKDIYIIKRLIGLPGDTVLIKDGEVYVNDELQKGDALTYYYADAQRTMETELKITLKDDEYFVLGDNRGNSADSRNYGAFSKKDIKAVYDRDMVKVTE